MKPTPSYSSASCRQPPNSACGLEKSSPERGLRPCTSSHPSSASSLVHPPPHFYRSVKPYADHVNVSHVVGVVLWKTLTVGLMGLRKRKLPQ